MFIIIIILTVIILKWYFKVKEGECVLIFANIGAGKTTLLSRYAQRELHLIKKGKSKYKHIISNTPICGCKYVPNIRNLLQSSTPEYTLILVDEAGIVWNNRKMKITDEEIEFIKLIRHYHSKLIAISQSYDDVDITIRRIYTCMYMLNKLPEITLIRPIKKFVTIDQETQQIIDGYKFKNIFSWRTLYRRKYFGTFDTYWIPEEKKKSNLKEFSIIPYDHHRSKFIKSIIPIVNKIMMKKSYPVRCWASLNKIR